MKFGYEHYQFMHDASTNRGPCAFVGSRALCCSGATVMIALNKLKIIPLYSRLKNVWSRLAMCEHKTRRVDTYV